MTTPTTTQIRTAILRAADHIEGNPELYRFHASGVPGEDGGCPACMWGWVGWFLGMYGVTYLDVTEACGRCRLDLYKEVPGLNYCDAASSAVGLRSFADKYFPETYPAVQAELDRIFAGEVTA